VNKDTFRMVKAIEGITLIELLAVISIVGILAAVAVPSYTGYMQRGRRAEAKTALEQVRAAQEMWRSERGTYAIDDGNGTALAKLQNTTGAPATVVSNYYAWGFTAFNATAFTARATPGGGQASDGWLEINQNGVKTDQGGYTYPDSRCKWSK